jgi:hypothetical protein
MGVMMLQQRANSLALRSRLPRACCPAHRAAFGVCSGADSCSSSSTQVSIEKGEAGRRGCQIRLRGRDRRAGRRRGK